MANILVITRGTRGDIVISLALAKALNSRQHKVTLLTHSFYSELAKEAGLDFVALDVEEEFDQFIEDGNLLNSPAGITTFFQKHILKKILSDYEIIKSKFIAKETLIVARYMSEIGAIFASEKLNIPIVRLFPHVASVMTMPILAEICGKNLATDINALRKKIDLPEISDWKNWIKYSHKNIASWPEWFSIPDESWPIKVEPIGFLLDDTAEGGKAPDNVENLLNQADKPILISAGTGKFLGEKFYSSSVEACKKLGHRAILVTPYDEFVPQNLGEKIYRFKYLPFASLMSKMKAIIHHGGTSTIARAIEASIPQLALASGGDRPDTAIRLEKLGVAKFLSPPYWQGEIVAQTLNDLLNSETVARRCIELSTKLQSSNPTSYACQLIENTLTNHQATLINSEILAKSRIDKVNELSADKRALLALLLSKKQTDANIVKAENKKEDKPVEKVVITASFTAQPIKLTLDFWINKLELETKVEFAPYSQIFQELMDKNSLTLGNKQGFNILLLKIEDLYQSNQTYSSSDLSNSLITSAIENNLNNLLELIISRAKESIVPYIFVLCPSSPKSLKLPASQEFLIKMQNLVLDKLQNINGLHLITHQEINEFYLVKDYYDEQSDKGGHIPYSPLFFTSLATILVRRIYRIKAKSRKVIVLDCDQTLWQGVCGEDGSLGVKIDSPSKALQNFVLSQYQEGMLICLCSKNNEEDVLEVFNKNAEMILSLEHITSYRINWKHKSDNLSSLAEELKLGLDSFIFIDDDSLECGQIELVYPQVLTLLLPKDRKTIPNFLNHIWDFDHLKLTEEDKRRSLLYKENQARESFSKQTKSLTEFLEQLNLEVNINSIKPEQIQRVAQLTQRTNQFNFTAITRNENEVEQISKNFQILVTEVKDRFGDYGLVGAIIFELGKEALRIDTFLLSCRALGRGVEHKMAAKLGEIAGFHKLNYIEIPYNETSKNKPAKEFLLNIFSDYKQLTSKGIIFKIPSDFIAKLTYNPVESAATREEALSIKNTEQVITAKSKVVIEIANNLSTPEEILFMLQSQKTLRPNLAIEFLEPQSEVEKKVAQIWAEALGLKEIGLNDNFFDLGGHSFLATQIASKLSKEFNFEVPILAFFEKPTIATLAKLISQQNNKPTKSSTKESYLDETIALAKRRKERLRGRN